MVKIERKQKQGFGSFGTLELSMLEGTIIASFFPEAEDMTINEIIKRTDYSYERVNTALKSLVEKGIVKEKKVGKTLVYSPNLNNLYVEIIGFNSYMLQKEIEFIKKNKNVYNAIKEIEENPFIWGLILFGSYSKGLETKQSDIDLICIASKEEEVKRFLDSLRHKYNIKFAPVILPLHEFQNIKKDNPELWSDLKIYGIVFKGGDSFFYWMYKNESS
jgi:predicted transcriptional regulator